MPPPTDLHPPDRATQSLPVVEPLKVGPLSVPWAFVQLVVKDVPLLIVVAILAWFVVAQEQHIKELQTVANTNSVALNAIARELQSISDTLKWGGLATSPRGTGAQP